MVDVTASVLPVRELCLVMALFDDGRIVLWDRLRFPLGRLHSDGFERYLLSRAQIHGMRVDDSSLLLKVKGVFLSQDLCFLQLICKLLLVEGSSSAFRVRVTDEPVCAPHSSASTTVVADYLILILNKVTGGLRYPS